MEKLIMKPKAELIYESLDLDGKRFQVSVATTDNEVHIRMWDLEKADLTRPVKVTLDEWKSIVAFITRNSDCCRPKGGIVSLEIANGG